MGLYAGIQKVTAQGQSGSRSGAGLHHGLVLTFYQD